MISRYLSNKVSFNKSNGDSSISIVLVITFSLLSLISSKISSTQSLSFSLKELFINKILIIKYYK